MKTLGELGEREVIERLARLVPGREDVCLGIGDDTAVVRLEEEGDLLLTSDPLVEGTHFTREADPRQVGHKAVGRVLSDLAAMGGEPLWALVNVTAPPGADVAFLEGVYRGAAALADRYALAIVGGDLARAEVLQIHVFAVGRVPAGAAIRRSGARPGDRLYVTGSLGGSASGKHLSFEPRITEGLWLREQGWPHAMIDLSDGLARDLRHLLRRSGVGAEIEEARIPVSEAARNVTDGRTPLEHALCDGEDFELLLSVSGENAAAFESSWADTFDLPCTPVGRITDEREVLVLMDPQGRRTVYEGEGYEHFRA